MRKIAVIPVVLAAGITLTPPAHADMGQLQAQAEQSVATAYSQVQTRCTPSMHPSLQSIAWDSFQMSYGTGRIIDANPSLGGPFKVYAASRVAPASGTTRVGYWDVELDFC